MASAIGLSGQNEDFACADVTISGRSPVDANPDPVPDVCLRLERRVHFELPNVDEGVLAMERMPTEEDTIITSRQSSSQSLPYSPSLCSLSSSFDPQFRRTLSESDCNSERVAPAFKLKQAGKGWLRVVAQQFPSKQEHKHTLEKIAGILPRSWTKFSRTAFQIDAADGSRSFESARSPLGSLRGVSGKTLPRKLKRANTEIPMIASTNRKLDGGLRAEVAGLPGSAVFRSQTDTAAAHARGLVRRRPTILERTGRSSVSIIGRVMTIIVAEHPLDHMRPGKPFLQPEDAVKDDYTDAMGPPLEDVWGTIVRSPRDRFQEIVVIVIVIRHVHFLLDRSNLLRRWHAVVQLETLLANHGHKAEVVGKLQAWTKLFPCGMKSPTFKQRLALELQTTMERWQEWIMPAEMDEHKPYFSALFSIIVLVPFFHMTGAYEHDLALAKHPCNDGAESLYQCSGPASFFKWLDPFSIDRQFSERFLREWGARYGPDLANGESFRWFTSVIIHKSFPHVFANWLLVISMSPYLETKYGAWRVAILWFISCLGGQLTSAIGEDKCKMVVGASGGVFGLVGLFVADMAINFRTIKRPILRCILILVVMSFCMAEMKVPGVSSLSHVGGLLCGMCVAFLLLPRVQTRKAKHAWRSLYKSVNAIAVFMLFSVFVGFPSYIYLAKLSGAMDCHQNL